MKQTDELRLDKPGWKQYVKAWTAPSQVGTPVLGLTEQDSFNGLAHIYHFLWKKS